MAGGSFDGAYEEYSVVELEDDAGLEVDMHMSLYLPF